MNKKIKIYQNYIVDYAYGFTNDSNIQTYLIIKQEELLYKVKLQVFNYYLLGEYTIEKLRNRGYISLDEIYTKYNVDSIEEKVDNQKKKIFTKRT